MSLPWDWDHPEAFPAQNLGFGSQNSKPSWKFRILGLKFQNILEHSGVRKENLDFLDGIWNFQPFPMQGNSKEKDSKELASPRGNKNWEYASQKPQKLGKLPQFLMKIPRSQNSRDGSVSAGSQISQKNPQEPLEFPTGIPALHSGWKITGFGTFLGFFPIFLSSNGTKSFG